MAAKSLSVVLVSGGLDSCVTAAIAAKEGDVALLHVNYGQRTEEKELSCFNRIADRLRAKETLIVDFQHLKTIGASSLTDKKSKSRRAISPEKTYPRPTCPSGTRISLFSRCFMGRGHRGEKRLHRRGRGGQFRVSRLQGGVFQGV